MLPSRFFLSFPVVLTLMATHLPVAAEEWNPGWIDARPKNTSGNPGSSSDSNNSSGPSINPGQWSSGPGSWNGQRPPAPSAPIVTIDDSANKQSMETRAQAYLGHQHYKRGYDLSQAGQHTEAAEAFSASLDHLKQAKALGVGDQLDRKLAEATLALACAQSAQAFALLDAGSVTNAKKARELLEKALSAAPQLNEARQTLLRAQGGAAEAEGRTHLQEGHWPEAIAAFRQSQERFQEAVDRATTNDQRSKGAVDQAFTYTALAAQADLIRAKRLTATALNRVAATKEKDFPREAYAAAKEAAALWPEQAQLQDNLQRLARIPVEITPPAQGGDVDLRK